MFSTIFKKDGGKGKSAQTTQDGRPVVTRKQTFATLTIADLQKADKNVPYISNPIQSTATRNGIPIATSPTTSSVSEASGSSLRPPPPAAQSLLSFHPGASRDILQNSVQTPIDGKAESCAASIVSPGGRGWSPVTPMSETGDDISPIMSRRPAKHTTQLPTIVDENVDERDYEDNPFADGKTSMRIFPPGQTPRLPISRGTSVADPFNDRQTLGVNTETKTPRLRALYTSFWAGQYTSALSPYVKSATPVSAASRSDSRWYPFGRSPQEQQLGHNLREQERRPPSPSEYSLRYSDCGRNPFDGLDEEAIRERDSSGVGNLWNMILNRKRSRTNLSEPPTPATAISRNVTGNSAVSGNDDLFQYYQQPTTPHQPSAKHSSNVLVDYDGRPSTRNLTTRMPSPKVSEPYQLQSPSEEFNDVSKQHILRLEAEIAELKRWKEIQQDREKNKEIIQRQLESERELAELRRTMEAQEIARRLKQQQQQQQQQNESPVSPEVDRKRNNGNGFPADRRSMETVATVATQWPSGIEESPMPSSSHHFDPSLRELRDCYIRNAQDDNTSPAAASEHNFPNDNKSRNMTASLPQETAGSPSQRPREFEVPETPCEAFSAKVAHIDDANAPRTRASDLPPPYSRNPIRQFAQWRKSRNAGQHVRMDSHDSVVADAATSKDGSNSQGGSRFPVKPSSLPKLTITKDEDGLHMPPKQLTLPYNSPQMKFTPTTPHLARSETYPNRQFRPVQQVTLTSMGLAGKRPHELRDEAEKKRKRQEKRERLLSRGGWCWLCGLCCGPRKMSKKQKWCWAIFFLILIILGIIFGVLHAVKSKARRVQEVEDEKAPQFITIRNFPPMPVGNLTITPRTVQKVSTCTTPPTLWSCSLPPPVGKGESQDMPVLQWLITPKNGTSIRLRDQAPSPPSIADYRNFSSLDGITEGPAEGEETEFLASMMIGAISAHAEKPESEPLQKRSHPRDILNRRQDSNETESSPSSSADTSKPSSTSTASSDDSEDPFFTSAPVFTLDPEPSSSATATDSPASSTAVASSASASATATGFPTIPEDPEIPDSPTEGKPHLFPEQYVAQPLRFFNRGQADEHYGFSTYFSKIIYLRSIDAVGPDGNNPLDSVGGVPPAEARWVCKWPQTRYVVKIYTNSKKESDGKVKVIVDPASLAVDKSKYAGGLGGYPVTVEEDRAATHIKGPKSVGRCWPIDERGNLSPVGWKFIPEFNNGINGGGKQGKGCQCVWNNWKEVGADEL